MIVLQYINRYLVKFLQTGFLIISTSLKPLLLVFHFLLILGKYFVECILDFSIWKPPEGYEINGCYLKWSYT